MSLDGGGGDPAPTIEHDSRVPIDEHTRWLGLLAIVIGEWDAALTHLQVVDLASHGHAVTGLLAIELDAVCEQWREAVGTPWTATREEVISDARWWATEHLSVINDLTNEEGVTHDPTQGG